MRMRDGSGTVSLKYLVEDMDRHGNVRVYVRRNGRKVRLQETTGTEAFMAEYWAALQKLEAGDLPSNVPSPAAPGSFRWLVERYYKTPEFGELTERTRRVRRGILDGLCEKHGAKRCRVMEPRHVRAIRDEKRDLPEAANARVKALRQLFAWAIDADLADSNPARNVPYLKGNPEGWHTWTEDEVRQFEDRHPVGTKARLALGLLLYLGVRRGDVVRLGPQMERDGFLHFVEDKNHENRPKERDLPILHQLRAIIDVSPSGHLSYLVTVFGKPFTANGFGNWFKRRCHEAGLDHCSAHGLRKAGATRAAENGATEQELMAIFGWQTSKEATRYTRAANRKKMAAGAMHKLVADQKENKTVPLSDVISAGGTIREKKA